MSMDKLTLEHLQKSMEPEEFKKAMDKAGLVYVQKQVTKKGKTYMQGFWVSAKEAKSEDKGSKAELQETVEKYTIDGKYTPERAALHDKIVGDIVSQCSKPKPGEKPVVVIMGGGSASGKSTMRRNVIDKHMKDSGIETGTVDSDEIKESIPEYADLKKTHTNEAARLVHEESSDIGALAIETLINEGRNFVYDGTMKNAEKYGKLIDELKEKGFDVHVYVCDIPLEEAYKRSDARAERTGRKVPHKIIESSHRGVPKTLESIKDKVASYKVFDNTDTLKLIASNEHVDAELYSKFLEKGGIKFRATAEK